MKRRSRLASKFERLRRLPRRVSALEDDIGSLRAELEAAKTRQEISSELFEEFHEWKQAHPLIDRPLVSVCVATYNRAELLIQRCISSVLAQTYTHFELIVVGDGCTDETEAAVGAIGDARITFVSLPERGRYPSDPWRRWLVAGTPALNTAMSLATGDVVTHLDDDDEYLPERLETLVGFMQDEQCDFVWHPFWYESATDGRWNLNEARIFGLGSVTTSSVFYRSWLKRIAWDIEAHRLLEPGDWNRFRRMKYLGVDARRYPHPLLRHYRERMQSSRSTTTT